MIPKQINLAEWFVLNMFQKNELPLNENGLSRYAPSTRGRRRAIRIKWITISYRIRWK